MPCTLPPSIAVVGLRLTSSLISRAVAKRVLNATNGSQLENARVTIQGTNLQAFINAYNEYRLMGFPAGPATLQVFLYRPGGTDRRGDGGGRPDDPAGFGIFSVQRGEHRHGAKNSQFISELITAAYLMGDSRLMNNRLRLVYGLRFERTLDSGFGYIQDVNTIYQRDTNGNFLLAASGNKIPIVAPNGKPITAASNALLLNQMEFKNRALHTTEQYASA